MPFICIVYDCRHLIPLKSSLTSLGFLLGRSSLLLISQINASLIVILVVIQLIVFVSLEVLIIISRLSSSCEVIDCVG